MTKKIKVGTIPAVLFAMFAAALLTADVASFISGCSSPPDGRPPALVAKEYVDHVNAVNAAIPSPIQAPLGVALSALSTLLAAWAYRKAHKTGQAPPPQSPAVTPSPSAEPPA